MKIVKLLFLNHVLPKHMIRLALVSKATVILCFFVDTVGFNIILKLNLVSTKFVFSFSSFDTSVTLYLEKLLKIVLVTRLNSFPNHVHFMT